MAIRISFLKLLKIIEAIQLPWGNSRKSKKLMFIQSFSLPFFLAVIYHKYFFSIIQEIF